MVFPTVLLLINTAIVLIQKNNCLKLELREHFVANLLYKKYVHKSREYFLAKIACLFGTYVPLYLFRLYFTKKVLQ